MDRQWSQGELNPCFKTASLALSQLSYGPDMDAEDGFEPTTSSL